MIRQTILTLMLLAGIASAEIPHDPEYTFRWSGFHSVAAVDSFLIGATDDGLAVLKRSSGQTEFAAVSNIFLPTPAREQKRFDSILVVRNTADQIDFFNLNTLPDLQWLGTVDIDIPFSDFVVDDSTLYTSREFDGLWRYRLHDYNSAEYLDSSIIGIRYTDLAIGNDTLYALDEYNGILFHRLADTGFAEFLDYLYIPFEASSFVSTDIGLAVATHDARLFLAQSAGGPPAVIDTFEFLMTPDRLFASGRRVIAATARSPLFEGIDLVTRQQIIEQGTEPPADSIFGTVMTFDATPHLAYPSEFGGLLLLDIEELFAGVIDVTQAVPRASQVTGLGMVNNRLFIGGENDALDVYTIDTDGKPIFSRTMFDGLNSITAISRVNESLFVSYPQLQRTLVLQGLPDTVIYQGGLYLDTTLYNRIIFNPFRTDTLRSYFAVGDYALRVFTLTDTGRVDAAGEISTLNGIHDLTLVDSILAISTVRSILLYRMYSDFSFAFRSAIEVQSDARELRAHHGQLLVFDDHALKTFNIRDASNPVLEHELAMPSNVIASATEGDALVTVGSQGIAVYDISGDFPFLLDHGGRPGIHIEVEHGFAAVSSGSSMHIYDLRRIVTDVEDPVTELPDSFELHQNYPNPFNPVTTIAFTLPRRERVTLTVYNVLGQEVRSLSDGELRAGRHTVVWDGTDNQGQSAATGLYLYRLTTSGTATTRKMLLVR